MTRLPDLVVGGAPKCGTSSLFNWLAQHPGVTPSEPKETFYLVDEESPFRQGRRTFHDDGLAGYSRFWPAATESPGLCVDGTTHYLYQRTARDVLAGLESEPQVAFILREPVDRVHSSFRFTQNMLQRVDPDLSFARYAEIVQRNPDDLDRYVDDPRSNFALKNDLKLSSYVDYLEAWQEALGENRLHVFLFEELKADPLGFVKSFAARFGLDPEVFRAGMLERKNPTLARDPMTRRLSSTLPRNRVTRWLYGLYARLRRAPQRPPSAADIAALESLGPRFVDSNRRLGEIFGLDLSAWEVER